MRQEVVVVVVMVVDATAWMVVMVGMWQWLWRFSEGDFVKGGKKVIVGVFSEERLC